MSRDPQRQSKGLAGQLLRRSNGSLAMPNVAERAYTLLALLPERDGKFQYRVESDREPYERVVKEGEPA